MQSTFVVEVPGLSADAEYEFSLLNGSNDIMQIAFDRKVLLSAMDGNGQSSQQLFVDAGVPRLEGMRAAPGNRDAALDTGAHAGSVMRIGDFMYRPGALHVRPGTAVTFVNNDAEAHTVTSVDGAFDSGTIDPGQRWQHTFDRAGRYAFRCTYHPYMGGEVDVR